LNNINIQQKLQQLSPIQEVILSRRARFYERGTKAEMGKREGKEKYKLAVEVA